MVRETGEITRPVRLLGERRERSAVKLAPAVWRNRLLDGQACQFVPKRDPRRLGAEHAGGHAFVEAPSLVPRQGLEQPQLHRWRCNGDGVENALRSRAQTCRASEHRVSDGVGDVAFLHRERLDDEERVAHRLPMKLLCVHTVRLSELRDRALRERRELDPVDRRAGCELAEHEDERMRQSQLVVSIGGDDERRDRLHAASKEPEHVKRRFVRPVHVLQNEDGRAAGGQLLPERLDHVVRHRSAFDDRLQLAPARLPDSPKRPERARREERVARTPESR